MEKNTYYELSLRSTAFKYNMKLQYTNDWIMDFDKELNYTFFYQLSIHSEQWTVNKIKMQYTPTDVIITWIIQKPY